MKFTKIALLGAVLAISAPLAFADTITGEVDAGGTGVISSTSATFTPAKKSNPNKNTAIGSLLDPGVGGDLGVFATGSGLFIAGAPTTAAKLTFGTIGHALATPVLLFTATESGETFDFYVTEILARTVGAKAVGVTPAVTGSFNGLGYITLSTKPGLHQTATFFLTNNSPGSGSKTFSLSMISDASPAPEPSSLALLGTGIMGAAGMFLRRRSIA